MITGSDDSFAVLDAYADSGGNFLDTADSYSLWVDGHQGGEGGLQELCLREEIACMPVFGLARGFLTGKYRAGQQAETKRGSFVWTSEWDARSDRVLAALDAVAQAHHTTVAAVALAWLGTQPGVLSPLASARTVEQLRQLLPMATLELAGDEFRRPTEAGAVTSG